nr:EOG090X043H [Lepidurus arcticus]
MDLTTPSTPGETKGERWPVFMLQLSQSGTRHQGGVSASGKSSKKRDPMQVERTNLVNLCKLIVKELIDSSLKYGRMLDSDYVPLQHFFIVLEHVFRHGLRPKKGLLGPKKELWDLLQIIEKYCPDAADITASIRDLPSVKTHMGRARAWLRLALMQKKIADYLKVLLDHRDDIMSEFFEMGSLLVSDEAVIIMGLLLGLNVIDCNICIKGEDLDSQQGVIDFSLYLRNGSGDATPPPNSIDNSSMTAVLDQKNYVEELNRHLTATVSNLQARVESLTTTNALMKEDLSLTKSSFAALQQENTALKGPLKQDRYNVNLQETDSTVPVHMESPRKSPPSATVVPEDAVAETKLQLAEEKNRRLDLEKELEIQTSIRAETEVALKLLEKDIHEKQDTIISLRRQLDDIKLINLEMYRKLQECEQEINEKGEMACEAALKHKSEYVAQLETNVATLTESVQRLDTQVLVSERSKKEADEAAVVAHDTAVTASARLGATETDLRLEREWREALQETMVADREKIANLQTQVLEAGRVIEVKKAFDFSCKDHQANFGGWSFAK